ncbi:MAG: PIN domain-containing protein [Fimbriimonadales bacterium]
MKYLLDTDILIDILRGYTRSVEWLTTQIEPPAIVSVCVMELIQGCRSKRDLQAVEQLIAPLDVWYPTADDMQLALEQFKTHFLKARLSAVDAIVAAVAMTRATPLCTFNTKHYSIFPITVVEPYPKRE